MARLSLTQLDDRIVPAGMIDVTFMGGYLEVHGGDEADHVSMDWLDGSTIKIATTSGTIKYIDSYIQDENGEFVPIYGYGPDVTINLSASGAFLEFNANFNMGRGNDRIRVTGLGDGFINSYHRYSLRTGHGDDFVHMSAVGAQSIHIQTDYDYLSGAFGVGDDTVILDTISSRQIGIATDKGNDRVTVTSLIADLLSIDTDRGDDRVILSGTNHFDRCIINLGGGDDSVVGDNVDGSSLTCAHLVIDGGKGDDRLLNADYFLGPNVENVFLGNVEHQD